ncbi:hypothetical protein GobsT_61920 [Gemmata obscuriglobus]|uniref:Uncharacterized protein n=1 Tax=Gemmata obscuriglobus TaxID=114 RepID=A0A2Z3GQE8_9BACT|nr:hypothetical protein [Gemmata obscuriglobus]AWM36053.1 hypothetical protein C1280_02870 [Gemmata obscuriglobus]QEG31371.1 hypothetical protein GobsT_61920 [Gemmata obscuriglobus]VTS10711.1 unnamed protein product [Gemmata obscuriglobus UQM 2246]
MAGVSLGALPDFEENRAYRVAPYLHAAVLLQTVGEQVALETLTALAEDEDQGHKVIILCRMLFTARRGGEFRRPAIGVLGLYGGTEGADWPLEPIACVRGVPFLVYPAPYKLLAGFPEPGSWYLRYCAASCAWSNVQFALKSDAEKAEALGELLACGKWRSPLADHEVEGLAAQTRP